MNSYDKHITSDQLIFEYLEGNLRPEEKKIIDHNIQNNPEFKLQFEMWQATYVKEPLPLFNKKANLHKPVPKGFGIRSASISLIMLASIGIIGFFIIQQKDKKTQTSSVIPTYTQVIPPFVDSLSKDKINPKKNIKPANNTKLHSKVIKNTPKVLSSEPSFEVGKDTFTHSTKNLDSVLIPKASPDSINQKPTAKTDSVSIKNITKKPKKYRKRIRWKDIKRAWYNEPTVVPMQ
jgi:hypothetical protein